MKSEKAPQQYIPKSALATEIERLMEELQDKVETSDFIAGEVFIMNYFLSFIDIIEVKEVGLPNFEQEVKEFCYRFDDRKESWYNMTPHDKNIMVSPTWSNFAMQLAKHFFELGMQVSNKAQKGEK